MKTPIASAQYAVTAADLQVVLALVRGRTLAEAAARAGSDPSTVFRSLQRLERQIGQRLFERSREGYLPTDGALVMAGHAERIEAELEEARSATAGPQEAVSGRVRLTTTDSVLRGLVLPTIPALAKAHPLLQLEVQANNALSNLTLRDADLALRATPKPPQHLIGRELGQIQFVVAGSAGDRGSSSRRPLELQDWVAPDESMPEHPSVRWRRRAFPKLAPRLLADGIVGVVDAIRSGCGIGVVPKFMLAIEPQLRALSEPLEGCESTLWLLAHPESRHLRRISAVYQHLAEKVRLT
ncbi:MAG: LysR family transcriptional regulator [Ramlibacter sp.]